MGLYRTWNAVAVGQQFQRTVSLGICKPHPSHSHGEIAVIVYDNLESPDRILEFQSQNTAPRCGFIGAPASKRVHLPGQRERGHHGPVSGKYTSGTNVVHPLVGILKGGGYWSVSPRSASCPGVSSMTCHSVRSPPRDNCRNSRSAGVDVAALSWILGAQRARPTA